MDICKTELCTGCECCKNICPKHCISMESDQWGYYIPMVDEHLCINCKACVNHCPANHPQDYKRTVNQFFLKVYSSEKKQILSETSSGGTISEIELAFIKSGGAVFATIFNDNWEPIVVKISDQETLKKAQGSKYVQSKIGQAFIQIKELIKNGIMVLFVGTPCQVAGLTNFLGEKNLALLYTIDLFCAGVASPGVFKKYIREVTSKYTNVISLNFRDKTYGYGYYLTSLRTEKGKRFLRGVFGEFALLGGRKYIRESCLQCKYRSLKRLGDISIGDYGRSFLNETELKRGANFVIVNSDKGKDLLYHIGASLSIFNADEKVVCDKLLSLPVKESGIITKPNHYNQFHACVLNSSWKNGYRRYLKKKDLKTLVMRIIPLKLLFFIRNIR